MNSREELQLIAKDHQNGMTYKAIALKYQIDQRTAKRYADNNLPLSELYHRPFSSISTPTGSRLTAGFSGTGSFLQ